MLHKEIFENLNLIRHIHTNFHLHNLSPNLYKFNTKKNHEKFTCINSLIFVHTFKLALIFVNLDYLYTCIIDYRSISLYCTGII